MIHLYVLLFLADSGIINYPYSQRKSAKIDLTVTNNIPAHNLVPMKATANVNSLTNLLRVKILNKKSFTDASCSGWSNISV